MATAPKMTRPWTVTFDDPNDGCVRAKHLDHSTDVMRVMLRAGGPQSGRWFWTVSRLPPNPDGSYAMAKCRNASGYEETKEAAQRAAEEAYAGFGA